MTIPRGVIAAAAAGFLAAAPAVGQEQARVTAVVRTVKRSPEGAPAWKDARLGDGLATGDRVRTGRRSRAGMRFRDGSAMRVDELSEVLVRGGTRDVSVNRGGFYADYKGPGTVSGGYAVAAVRGTKFEFRREGGAVRVRCFSGSVHVLGGGGDARAGGAGGGSRSTLVDQSLIGDRRDWVGSTLRIMSGPDLGEQRRIVAFDSRTGTITLDPPLGAEIGAGTEYLLSTRPEVSIVTLTAGTETTVRDRERPRPPRKTIGQTFAGGQERPWFDQVVDGVVTEVFAGTETQATEQEHGQSLDESVGKTTSLAEHFGNTETLAGNGGSDGGGAEIVIPTPGDGGGAEIVIPTPTTTAGRARGARARTRALGTAGAAASATTIPLSLLALAAQGRGIAAGGRVGFAWESEPFAFVGDEGDAAGVRSRVRAMSGRWMTSVGARFGRFNGECLTDLHEAFLLYRAPGAGDLKVGRQYLFLGPASNSDLGKLVGFNTMDGVFWIRRPGRGIGWHAGYVRDSAPLVGDGFSGWLGRAHGRAGKSAWGVNLLTANRAGGGLGASADLAFPLLPGRLEAYVEGGRDPFDHDLFTGGFHLPGLYQAAKVDAFVEYQSRGGFDDRVSLRMRSELAPGWLLFGQVSKELGGATAGGAGLQYRLQW